MPMAVLQDHKLTDVIRTAAIEALEEMGQPWQRLRWFVISQADPNDWRLVRANAFGVRYLPRRHVITSVLVAANVWWMLLDDTPIDCASNSTHWLPGSCLTARPGPLALSI